MNRRLKHVMMFTAFSAACAIVPCWPRLLASPIALQESPQAPQGQKDFEQRALIAERAFVDAAAKSDAAALDKLLDVRFTWTAAGGKTLTRQEVLQQAPKPAITDADAQFTAHNYGSLESIQIHRGKRDAPHVWGNRRAGWRMLPYQEVRRRDAPREAAPPPPRA